MNKILSEKGEVTTNTAEIQSIIRNYYKQLYTNRPSPRNGQIFRKAQYPNTEPRRNKIITINEIESVILKLLPNKIPGSDGITSEFYQTFRKER